MARILVIDDDGIVRDALGVFLTRAGHTVLTAADGANGVLVFKNNLPDLVILDRDLPVMSGSGVFDNIRKISAATPVVILTGYNAPEEAEAYLRCGAAAFLSKAEGLSRVLDEVDRLLGSGRAQKAGGPAAAGTMADKPAARWTALVADDDAQTRKILKRLLTSLGCEALEAADGSSAVVIALERRPDIILLDINMPGKTGLEVLKELVPRMPDAGFIMITGNEDENLARECLQAGAFDYASKPVNLDALAETIKARLLLQEK